MAIWAAFLISRLYLLVYLRSSGKRIVYRLSCIFLIGLSLFSLISLYASLIFIFVLGLCEYLLIQMWSRHSLGRSGQEWWEFLLAHPARLLSVSFLVLCVIGTLLLGLPYASSGRMVSLVDAAFTSVSAVCVTGLIVLDTPVDFSWTGQFFILLLIQLGGLGIMTIGAVAIHGIGQRLSSSGKDAVGHD